MQGPAGLGVKLLDRNGAIIGTVLRIERNGVDFITSTGHVLFVQWDGNMPPDQLYFSANNCGGTAYLNAGSATAPPLHGRRVVRDRINDRLLVAANPLPAGWDNGSVNVQAVAAPPSWDSSAAGGGCDPWSFGNVSGYRLEAVAPAGIGLNRYPILSPLQFAQ